MVAGIAAQAVSTSYKDEILVVNVTSMSSDVTSETVVLILFLGLTSCG